MLETAPVIAPPFRELFGPAIGHLLPFSACTEFWRAQFLEVAGEAERLKGEAEAPVSGARLNEA